ncbi:unnamed protein product [Polarella glacialis]|uniref:Uncharacterized protein n=1 Tax=Polarella glacialis TaxID=89957 RepID=A0A813GJG8_POLGL|nr:unnamed protein product [Polarella glacialis]
MSSAWTQGVLSSDAPSLTPRSSRRLLWHAPWASASWASLAQSSEALNWRIAGGCCTESRCRHEQCSTAGYM